MIRKKMIFYTNTTNIIDTTTLFNNDITTIAEDELHRIWIGNTSLWRHLFNPNINRFIYYIAQNGKSPNSVSIASNDINRIVVGHNIFWIAYSTGLLAALKRNTCQL